MEKIITTQVPINQIEYKYNSQDLQLNQQTQPNQQDLQKENSQKEFLPPPNPILNNKKDLSDLENEKSNQYRVVLKKGPTQQIREQIEYQKIKSQQQNRQNDPKTKIISNSQQVLQPQYIENNYISSHYQDSGYRLIYKKFENLKHSIIPSSGSQFYSGFFFDVKRFLKEDRGNGYKDQESFYKHFDVQQIDYNKQQNPQSLQFDSNFESGNLFAVYQVNEKEYDLILQNDINSKGNTQWFYFSVKNAIKGQNITFNIVNLYKDDSLFNYGMKPVVYSERRSDIGWFRGGTNIKYEKGKIPKDSSSGYYYQLSFSYKFHASNDTVQFAHSYPYKHSKLEEYLAEIYQDEQRKKFVQRNILCYSLAKIPCEVLTITSDSDLHLSKRKYVVFMARQHPGETQGSFMMEGVIDFLTDPDNEEAQFLRQTCIFKVIPMVNIDGVIQGNYRTSLAGVDLNRQWAHPSKELHPIIYEI